MAFDITKVSLCRTIIIAVICSCSFRKNSAKPANLMVSMSDRHPDPVTENIKHIQDVFQRAQNAKMEHDTNSAVTSDEVNLEKHKLKEKESVLVSALWKAVHKAYLSRLFHGGIKEGILNTLPFLSNGKSQMDFPNDRIIPLPPMVWPMVTSLTNDEDDIPTLTMATTENKTKGNMEKRGRRKHVLFRLLHPNRNFKFNFGKITIDPIYYFIGLGK